MVRPRGSPDSRPSRRPFRVWAPAFLAALRSTGIVTLAAHAAQIDRNAPYAARRRNPVFAQQWDAAIEDGIQMLEAEARRRAIKGSDLLMIFLLKAHRPERYRDNLHVENTGPGGMPLPGVTVINAACIPPATIAEALRMLGDMGIPAEHPEPLQIAPPAEVQSAP